MGERGFAGVLIIFFAVALAGLTYVTVKTVESGFSVENIISGQVATSSPIPSWQPQDTINTVSVITPVSLPSSTPNTKLKSPTIKPAATITPSPAAINNVCTIGVLADPSSVNNVRLAAGASSKNNSYITGAQWDFDGNGSWDTDMNISNQSVVHNYPNGSYTVKLKTKMSDGSTTTTCSNSVSTPAGFSVSLTGTVYEDRNCNDMREPDEKGLSGVKVSITNKDGYRTLTELTTDTSGYYRFNYVLSGNNSITVIPYAWPLDNYGVGMFQEHSISLSANQSSINIDLGEVPSPVSEYCHY